MMGFMVLDLPSSPSEKSKQPHWGTRIVVGASPLVVTDLGRWVRSGNTNAHTLKLVRSDGYDVPGASVSLNTSGATAGQFAYATLAAPVILEAGATYYLVSQETNGGDTWYDLDNTLVPTGAFTLTGQVWAYNSTTVYTVYSATNKGYIPVNLKYSIGAWNLSKETRYLYDGMLAVQERDPNNVPTTTYTRGRDLSGTLSGAGGIGGLLARTAYDTGIGTHAYYHADGNGNVTAMVNALQFVVAKYLYDPYGNTLSKVGPLAEANTLRFSSKKWCEGPGLYYYGYRFYDANLQRWVNTDPLGEEDGINLYAFSRNSPVSIYDTDGRWTTGVATPGIGWVFVDEAAAAAAKVRAIRAARMAAALAAGLGTTSPCNKKPEDPCDRFDAIRRYLMSHQNDIREAVDKVIKAKGTQGDLNSIPGLTEELRTMLAEMYQTAADCHRGSVPSVKYNEERAKFLRGTRLNGPGGGKEFSGK